MLENMDSGSLNYTWSLSIVHSYALSGVQHAVVSPGSRSTPLTLACERHAEIKTWVQVDERSAAFFALGLAMKSRRPVILVCTSGSAVANWLPAVVEANYSQVPLILLSADRPVELQDCGANQTIDQQHLFGTHVRAFYPLPEPAEELLNSSYLQQLVAKSIWQLEQPLQGPVHLNISFREPLLPAGKYLNETIDDLTRCVISQYHAVSTTSHQRLDCQSDISATAAVIQRGAGIIVVGRKHYSSSFIGSLNQLAERLNIPVLVDHLSNLRFGNHDKANFIVNYDLFLRQLKQSEHLDLKPEWVIRFGQFPVSKSLSSFLSEHSAADTVLVGENSRWQDPLRTADYLVQSGDEDFCRQLLKQVKKPLATSQMIDTYREFDELAAEKIGSTLLQQDLFEGQLINSLIEKIPHNSFIFSSNSTPVRELDTFTVSNQYSSKAVSIYCNRGASGIDGNLSTYLGILAENQESTGVALLGDLAFFHDMNGLALCADLNSRGFSGTIIIINNQGGHIFNYLPQKDLREFEKYWLTPTKMEIHHAAGLFGLRYQKADSIELLDRILEESIQAHCIDIIEVSIDQQTSLSSHELLYG